MCPTSKNVFLIQSKLFDHDNMKHLKKLLDELENVMDQVETELQRRVEETPGTESGSVRSRNFGRHGAAICKIVPWLKQTLGLCGFQLLHYLLPDIC